MRPKDDLDYSHPSSPEVKNEWIFTFTVLYSDTHVVAGIKE
jgi:hypothetical protein